MGCGFYLYLAHSVASVFTSIKILILVRITNFLGFQCALISICSRVQSRLCTSHTYAPCHITLKCISSYSLNIISIYIRYTWRSKGFKWRWLFIIMFFIILHILREFLRWYSFILYGLSLCISHTFMKVTVYVLQHGSI